MARLIRPLRKSILSSPSSSSSSQIPLQQISTLHFAPGKQVSLLNPKLLPLQSRTTYSETQCEIDRSPPNQLQPRRPFCAKAPNTNHSNDMVKETRLSTYHETLKQLDKLDFMKATKILFTGPPSKKKFGLDFHLVQLFFVCMPSLAVYLVAQYARYEIRKMEAELEQKKNKEAAAKAKEIELNATEAKEGGSVPELLEVKERLDKLEETVKEISVQSKKQMASGQTKDLEGGSEKKNIVTETNTRSKSESRNSVEKDPLSKQDSVEPGPALSKESGSAQQPVPNASLQDQGGKTQDGGVSQEAKS